HGQGRGTGSGRPRRRRTARRGSRGQEPFQDRPGKLKPAQEKPATPQGMAGSLLAFRLFLFVARRELQRRAIGAVAQAGGLRPVLEDMAKMAAALGAVKLRAGHAMAGVGRGSHRSRDGVVKAGPARAALILRAGFEQLGAAAGAKELAGALLIIERAGAGVFGAMLAQDAVLLG